MGVEAIEMSRASAAISAARSEIERHRTALDAGGDVVSVTLTLKFIKGTTTVRGVVYQEERLSSAPDVRLRK